MPGWVVLVDDGALEAVLLPGANLRRVHDPARYLIHEDSGAEFGGHSRQTDHLAAKIPRGVRGCRTDHPVDRPSGEGHGESMEEERPEQQATSATGRVNRS